MDNNKLLILELQKHGVVFDTGLTDEEIKEIERLYGITIPESVVELYSEAIPVSEGFYNWRDMSCTNVEYIKNIMNIPSKNLLRAIDDIDWNNDWGDEPANIVVRRETIQKKIQKAPTLMPVYSHRYVPIIDVNPQPVLSIVGDDIIYYGENIIQYLQIEFGLIEYETIDYKRVKKIPFWSDFI